MKSTPSNCTVAPNSEVLQSSAGLNDKQLRWAGNIRSSGQQLLYGYETAEVFRGWL